jgi:hypothetical protein
MGEREELDRLDLELHARLRDGDPYAFEELYRRYAPGAYGLALRVTGHELLAQEVAHDAMEGLLFDRHRARELEVVARDSDPHRWSTEGVEPLGEPARQLISEDRVRAERKVVAVLLDRAEGDDDRVAAGSDLLPDLGPGEAFELERAHRANPSRSF